MKTKLWKCFQSLSLAFILSLAGGCRSATNNREQGEAQRGLSANTNKAEDAPRPSGREVGLGESFKLEPEEQAALKGTRLTVQLNGVRRSWYADGKGEFVDANLSVTLDGQEQTRWLKPG
ncbi:MAG TPA: hypothetical protein VJT09_08970, partial [Pyrinomonadaceae bacterium]|nr:hypothetical protein [Pyrinomonadaceae bacterium]